MESFEVVVWQDEISDGTLCYAAWCPAAIGVWGQGDTEAEAVSDILSGIAANVHNPWPSGAPAFYAADVGAAEMAELLTELDAEGIPYRTHHAGLADLPMDCAESGAIAEVL